MSRDGARGTVPLQRISNKTAPKEEERNSTKLERKHLDEIERRLSAQDSLQRSDHDALVRVEAKLDNLATDVKLMGDGMQQKLVDHESRIRKVEDVLTQADPINNTKLLFAVRDQIRDFKTSANAWRIAAGMMGGLVMFVLTQLPNILRLWGVLK